MLTATLATVSALCAAPLSADTLQALWDRGATFAEFLAGARARRDTWDGHYAGARLAPDVADRLRALPGGWRLLVVAEDACSDSANTIPFLAALVDSSAGRLSMRVIDSKVGRGVMEAHRTRDGRAATPTVILLDGDGREAGCWVERPSPLARWAEVEGSRMGDGEFLDRKLAWYREDEGRTTMRELLTMIEQVGQARACGGGA